MVPTEIPEAQRRLIISVARPTAFIPLSRAILGRMGYAIVPLDEWQAYAPASKREPLLALVDDRMFAALPTASPFDRLPILLLTGRDPGRIDDRRVLGAISQPAGLHELYRLLQHVLEPAAENLGDAAPQNLSAFRR